MKISPADARGNGSLSRRRFLKTAGGWGLSAASLALLEACGASPTAPVVGGDTLETTRIRLSGTKTSICTAPTHVAREFLTAEGFTDIQVNHYPTPEGIETVAAGENDFSMMFSAPSLVGLDAGKTFTLLAGIHIGCFELFGSSRISDLSELKGKMIAITNVGGPEQFFLASIFASVAIDPNTEVSWVTAPLAEAIQLFADEKVDGFLALPPVAQELRDKQIGHVLVNSMTDRPWSQYYCCMAVANREFAQQNPVATKRALRAMLNATDLCALEPARAARLLVDEGVTPHYHYALEAMQSIPYNRWRDYDPVDTLYFYGNALHATGHVQRSVLEVVEEGTNWDFLNEIKAELNAQDGGPTRSLFCPVPRTT